MKNLKKLLALMLVLVLALGMVPYAGANSAALMNVDDFTDSASIDDNYVEAVDVLAALGVYVGEGPEGSRVFNPKDTFTRAQAAAIMARIILGSETASRLPQIATGFSDVPAGHWAAGYVGFGVDREIILGYGDGTFGPDDPVTALQMARLLLGAIGYGTQGELQGPGWEIRTIERATHRNIRVLWGTGEPDYTAPATREEVARYTFNALTIPPMVSWNSIINDYASWSGLTFTGTDYPTLGEDTFALFNTKGTGDKDDFGFNQHFWFRERRPNRLTGSYMTGDVVDSFVAGSEHDKDYMFNNYTWDFRTIARSEEVRGTVIDTLLNGVDFSNTVNARYAYDFAERGSRDYPFAPGAYVTLVDEDWDGVVDKIVVVYEVLARVTSYTARTGVIEAAVYDVGDDETSTPYADGTVVTLTSDDFAVGDYILIAPEHTAAPKPTDFKAANIAGGKADYDKAPLRMVKADSIVGTPSGYTRTPSNLATYPTVTVNNQTLTFSAGLGLGSGGTPSLTRETTFYLDSQGSVVGYNAASRRASELDYVYIASVAHSTDNLFTTRAVRVEVKFTDGSTGNLLVPLRNVSNNWRITLYNANGTLDDTAPLWDGDKSGLVGDWFSYSLSEDGQSINLTKRILAQTRVMSNTNTIRLSAGNANVGGTEPSSLMGDNLRHVATSNTQLSYTEAGQHITRTGFANFPGSGALTAGTNKIWEINNIQGATGIHALFVYAPGTGPVPGLITNIYVIDGATAATPVYGIIKAVGDTTPDGTEFIVVTSDHPGGTAMTMRNPSTAVVQGAIVQITTPGGRTVLTAVNPTQTARSIAFVDPNNQYMAFPEVVHYATGALFLNMNNTELEGSAARPSSANQLVTYLTNTSGNAVAVVVNDTRANRSAVPKTSATIGDHGLALSGGVVFDGTNAAAANVAIVVDDGNDMITIFHSTEDPPTGTLLIDDNTNGKGSLISTGSVTGGNQKITIISESGEIRVYDVKVQQVGAVTEVNPKSLFGDKELTVDTNVNGLSGTILSDDVATTSSLTRNLTLVFEDGTSAGHYTMEFRTPEVIAFTNGSNAEFDPNNARTLRITHTASKLRIDYEITIYSSVT